MKLIGLTEEQIKIVLDYITKEHTTVHWGQECVITPCLINEIHGDGLQLVYLEPLDTRPNYYIIRIDSSIDVDDDETLQEEDMDEYGSISEMLLCMVESEYSNIDKYEEIEGEYYDDENEIVDTSFPMLHCSCGEGWGIITDCREKLGLIDTKEGN